MLSDGEIDLILGQLADKGVDMRCGSCPGSFEISPVMLTLGAFMGDLKDLAGKLDPPGRPRLFFQAMCNRCGQVRLYDGTQLSRDL